MIANPLLPRVLAEAGTVFADPFTDPELGPRWYLRFTYRGDRSMAIVEDADMGEVERLARQVVRRPPLVVPEELRA